MPVETPTESTPVSIAVPMAVEDLSTAQRNEFFKTGVLPEPEPPAEVKTEAAAEEGAEKKETAEEAAVAAAPESQPGKPLTREEKTSQRFEETRLRLHGEAETARAAEAAAKKEADDLRKQIEDLKKGAPPAPPAPVETATEKASEAEDPEPIEPVEPDEDNFPDFVDFKKAKDEYRDANKKYVKDLGAWSARQELKAQRVAADKAVREAGVQAQRAEQEKGWNDQVLATTQRHPDWAETVLAKEDDGKTWKIKFNQTTDEWALTSPVGPDVLYFLAKNPEELKRVNSLKNGYACVRELHKLESQIEKSLTTSQPEEKKPSEPPPAAPPPARQQPRRQADIPTELPGTQGGRTDDPINDAVKRNNAGDYMKLKNAEELAARKPRGT